MNLYDVDITYMEKPVDIKRLLAFHEISIVKLYKLLCNSIDGTITIDDNVYEFEDREAPKPQNRHASYDLYLDGRLLMKEVTRTEVASEIGVTAPSVKNYLDSGSEDLYRGYKIIVNPK